MAIPQTKPQLYSLAEFEALLARPENAGRLFELIDGEIVEKLPTLEHGEIALNIGSALRTYVIAHKLGRVATDARYQTPAEKQDLKRPNSRVPDVSFISKERLPNTVTKGAVPMMPDLAVEIQSPDQSDQSMLDTDSYYLANGCRMVLLVYPDRRIVQQMPAGAKHLYVGEDVIQFDPVIPGFSMKVADIFNDPLAEDEQTP